MISPEGSDVAEPKREVLRVLQAEGSE